MILADTQKALVSAPLDSKVFLHGPAGTGKSTVGILRLRHLLAGGVPGASILVLTPQRTLQDRYLEISRSADLSAGSEAGTLTISGLARRLCDLFWPVISDAAGFAHPERAAHFLTLESAQYYMAHLVRPLLDQGYFRSVTMDRNRLYAQILDSLNKAAAVGFPHTQIGARLDEAWLGDTEQRRIYADAQDCATRFRHFCLEHNLLDFSLQLELLWTQLWPNALVRDFVYGTFRHLIYDNLEEDVPRAHDIVREWLPHLDSALLIYDDGAGYRRFLGADPASAWELSRSCQQTVELHTSFVMSEDLKLLAGSLEQAIRRPAGGNPGPGQTKALGPGTTLRALSAPFFPALLDKVVDNIDALLQGGVSATEIAVIAPYLSDALLFAITNRFHSRGIVVRTHRPSRSLRDEPSARAMLTMAALAHPQWSMPPPRFDVARAFMAVLGMDLVRAHLLAEIVVRKDAVLGSFEEINADVQARITSEHGRKYTRLRGWLLDYLASEPLPLDHFLRRLFGELLSQPGFGFHERLDEARVVGNLVESVEKFRLAMQPALLDREAVDFDIGQEYMRLLGEGVLSAQYLESWRPPARSAVLVTPAHSFLMMNAPVAIQFWLNPGSSGWFERLDQPLTHTRVLSRGWPAGGKWSFADEEAANVEGLVALTSGLIHRCRQTVFLCVSQLGESGYEERGRLIEALDKVFHDSNSVIEI